MKVCEYFQILKGLDTYVGQESKHQIQYVGRYLDQQKSPSKEQGEKQMIYRRKCIIIEETQRSLINFQKFKDSKILTCRNPFRADEAVINYDMESEDEWAEENGEDLQDGDQKMSDDDEDDLIEQEEQKGFIVDDDYLSVSEMQYSNMSSTDQKRIQEDQMRRKAI